MRRIAPVGMTIKPSVISSESRPENVKFCDYYAKPESAEEKRFEKQDQFLYRRAGLSFIILPMLDAESFIFGKYWEMESRIEK